jgi:hypothetical protein
MAGTRCRVPLAGCPARQRGRTISNRWLTET